MGRGVPTSSARGRGVGTSGKPCPPEPQVLTAGAQGALSRPPGPLPAAGKLTPLFLPGKEAAETFPSS